MRSGRGSIFGIDKLVQVTEFENSMFSAVAGVHSKPSTIKVSEYFANYSMMIIFL